MLCRELRFIAGSRPELPPRPTDTFGFGVGVGERVKGGVEVSELSRRLGRRRHSRGRTDGRRSRFKWEDEEDDSKQKNAGKAARRKLKLYCPALAGERRLQEPKGFPRDRAPLPLAALRVPLRPSVHFFPVFFLERCRRRDFVATPSRDEEVIIRRRRRPRLLLQGGRNVFAPFCTSSSPTFLLLFVSRAWQASFSFIALTARMS